MNGDDQYQEGDILICRDLFSTKDRVFEKGVIYKVDFVLHIFIWIKQEPTNSVYLTDTVCMKISEVGKYFRCDRLERFKKLQKLNR